MAAAALSHRINFVPTDAIDIITVATAAALGDVHVLRAEMTRLVAEHPKDRLPMNIITPIQAVLCTYGLLEGIVRTRCRHDHHQPRHGP